MALVGFQFKTRIRVRRGLYVSVNNQYKPELVLLLGT